MRAEHTALGNLKLLADVYHLATMSEDLSAVLARYENQMRATS